MVYRSVKNIKLLLETMFHTGTANPNQKFTAQQMHDELMRRAQLEEFEESEIPKISTIQNWIAGFSRKWKAAMAVYSLEKEE